MRTQYAPTVRPNQVAMRNKFAAQTSKRRERKHIDLNWPVSVADGRTAVGVIDKVGDVFIAIDTRGVTLGGFSTLSEAVRIFPQGATDGHPSPIPAHPARQNRRRQRSPATKNGPSASLSAPPPAVEHTPAPARALTLKHGRLSIPRDGTRAAPL
jgi:hypothetical protein